MLVYEADNLRFEMEVPLAVCGNRLRVQRDGVWLKPHTVDVVFFGTHWEVVFDRLPDGGQWWTAKLPPLDRFAMELVLLPLLSGIYRHRELWERFERAYREGLLHETARELFGG